MRSKVGWSVVIALMLSLPGQVTAGTVRARIVDAQTDEVIPARVYVRSESGEWYFVTSADPAGSALPYEEQWVPMEGSVERHTTVSAHPFEVTLSPGEYTIEVERGKEYLPFERRLTVTDQDIDLRIPLKRWIHLAQRGWYSGETHVHRRIHELPNVMLAEDLNVAFPVTFWTTRSDAAPDLSPSPLRRQGPSPFGARTDAGVEPIQLDDSHVIFPRNTEYEVFSVGEKRHVLGAIFLLNHRTRFTATAPPVSAIAEQAHAEGGLLDLDKHSWPWSMMLVPVARVDLFELSNNSVWRTKFGFRNLPAGLPDWMNLETDSGTTLTEWGWLNYGFQVYYALLNCGFQISPTAGTASGVHPVPLGHSRVYVHTGPTFHRDRWLQGLKSGRSFVTTGPMLFARLDDQFPGETIQRKGQGNRVRVEIESMSARPVSHVQIIVNGEVITSSKPKAVETADGAWRAVISETIRIDRTSWVAVRSIEPQADGRRRFAHTAPWFITVDGTKIRPRKREVEWFVQLMSQQIERNREVISAEALAEFEKARAFYRSLLQTAE